MHTLKSAVRAPLDRQPLAPMFAYRATGASDLEVPARRSDDDPLQDHLDLLGGSGRVYRFSRLRAGHPLSPAGGNFVLACQQAGRLELVYVGAAESLLRETGRLWERAAHLFRADQVFSRLNVSGRARELELADILAVLRPPMNAAEPIAC